MKPNRLLYLFLVLCLAAACGRRASSVSPRLMQAEAVMFQRPDSALRLLRSMPVPADRENHALWCLLVTQAQYKQMLPIRSDSLIRIAYDYYQPTDSARRKAMAALYMGGVNYDLGNVEEAMNYYLEAKTEMEKTTDYKLGYLVMSKLGNLYLYRELSDYALNAFQQAYDYAEKDSCIRYEIASLKYIGRVYSIRHDFSQSVQYYSQALELSDNVGLEEQYYLIKSELAGVYSAMKQFNKALSLEKDVIFNNPSAQSYYGMGMNYLNLQKYDSAYYFLRQALNTDNLYTIRAVYDGLLYLSHQTQYQKYMAMFCDSLRFYEDSITTLDKAKAIIAYKEKYDNEKLITQKQQLELDKARTTRLLLIVIIGALVLVSSLVYFYLHREVVLRRKEKELNRLALKLHENEQLIERNESYIKELKMQIAQQHDSIEQQAEHEQTLASLHNENEELHKENARLSGSISGNAVFSSEIVELKRMTEELHKSRRREESLAAYLIQSHPLLSELHKKPVCLDYERIQAVCTLSDALFNRFRERLSQAVPSLSKSELLLCCLIKLHFSVSEIAVLLAISPASVSTTKNRAKNKIFSEPGIVSENKSLDVWIWEF